MLLPTKVLDNFTKV